jgi:hypothetical protein
MTSSEALRKAFADSKLSGMDLGALPLTSEISTHFPSIKDSEQYLTALASSWQSEKEIGSVVAVSLLTLMSYGLTGVLGDTGDSPSSAP